MDFIELGKRELDFVEQKITNLVNIHTTMSYFQWIRIAVGLHNNDQSYNLFHFANLLWNNSG